MNADEWWVEPKPLIREYGQLAKIESNAPLKRRIRWKELGFCTFKELAEDMGLQPNTIQTTSAAYDWYGLHKEYWQRRSLDHAEEQKKRQIELEEKHFKINNAKSQVLQTMLNNVIQDIKKGIVTDINDIIPVFKQLSELAKDERINVHLPSNYKDIKTEVKADVTTDLLKLVDEDKVHELMKEKC